MRTSPAVDRSPVLLATAWGLAWRICAFFFVLGLVLLVIGWFIYHPWVFLILLVIAVGAALFLWSYTRPPKVRR